LQANPFTVYPPMIISLPWLRTPRVQRLLDEVLDSKLHGPSFFDLMIVDEATPLRSAGARERSPRLRRRQLADQGSPTDEPPQPAPRAAFGRTTQRIS